MGEWPGKPETRKTWCEARGRPELAGNPGAPGGLGDLSDQPIWGTLELLTAPTCCSWRHSKALVPVSGAPQAPSTARALAKARTRFPLPPTRTPRRAPGTPHRGVLERPGAKDAEEPQPRVSAPPRRDPAVPEWAGGTSIRLWGRNIGAPAP